MVKLSENWLTEGLIDFEYKKYIVLSYLTHVQNQFSDKKLYPVLSDLQDHYQNLYLVRNSKEKIKKMFPKEIVGFDSNGFSFLFRDQIQDSGLISELDDIVDYSLDVLNGKLTVGHELLNDIISHIIIEPIGISPIDNNEGYLLLYFDFSKEVNIYKYTLSPVKGLKDSDDAVKTCFVTSKRISFGNSLENIKKEMLKVYTELPNPATFSVMSKVHIPYVETFLPVAKKLLIEKLAA